ncbi:response regulator [Pseudomonas sp. R1-7]|uniref:response regulator n=1 Tax=Pseudomonas sp. R1-7 TaxID=2817398 RepID=UPI003DA81940
MTANWKALKQIEGEILIVEDDPTLRALTKQIVEEIEIISAETVTFETADQALVYLLQSRRPCSLAIVDYGLPGQINGMDFIRMVRNKWPSIKTILMSGYALMPETVPSPTVYLQKPWSMNDLTNAVTDLLHPDYPATERSRLFNNN